MQSKNSTIKTKNDETIWTDNRNPARTGYMMNGGQEWKRFFIVIKENYGTVVFVVPLLKKTPCLFSVYRIVVCLFPSIKMLFKRLKQILNNR
jgi:hypothetical protein